MFFNKNKNYGIRQDVNGIYHIYEGECQDKDLLNNICNTLNADMKYPYYIVQYNGTNIAIIINSLERKHFYEGEYNHSAVTILDSSKCLDSLIEYYVSLKKVKPVEYAYIILGEYPNMFIDKKEIVYSDDYNYCLKDLKTKNLMLVSKDKCFEEYEEAVNYLAKKIQRQGGEVPQSFIDLSGNVVYDKIEGKIETK